MSLYKHHYRGVILAGGSGTRMGLLTAATNKHLLPLGDYPLLVHSVYKLLFQGIETITVVTSPEAMGPITRLLAALKLTIDIDLAVQKEPGGIAQALTLADRPGDRRNIAVLLGDQVFEDDLNRALELHLNRAHGPGCTLVLKTVHNPKAYGVAVYEDGKLASVEEKPEKPLSSFAVTGVYLYDPTVFERCRSAPVSARGEQEITSVNNGYISQNLCQTILLPGYWTDAGTPETWWLANQLVRARAPAF